jgi:NAD-dependent dihydropyrimidine dehydrogenase PreA subunit
MKVYGDIKVSDKKTNNNQWHGVPRAEIQWQPTVITDRCVGCGLCATSCGRGVYAFDYESNRPVVVAPEMCMVGCTTCATICTQDAIEFPSTGYIRQLIRQKKLLRQSKDMLKANREKYDVSLRQTAAG